MFLPSTGMVTVVKPMAETTIEPLAGTLIVNFPSTPVEVPVIVPSTMTVAPGTGAPFAASVTVPDTLCVWANAVPMQTMRHSAIENNFLPISLKLKLKLLNK